MNYTPTTQTRSLDSTPAEYSSRSARDDEVKITIPARGKKRALIKLGEQNAKEYLEQYRAFWERGTDASHASLKELKDALNLKDIPHRIEGYDISNIQGNFSVGSMVVFTNGEPDKNEYRKFKIKTVKDANDSAMLAEVLKRRFKRTSGNGQVAHGQWKLPDVVLLDGGKGQLSAVIHIILNKTQTAKRSSGVEGSRRHLDDDKTTRSLDSTPAEYSSRSARDDVIDSSQFIALAKRKEEVFQGKTLKKVKLDPKSDASQLLQRIRDEAHRFAQKYYHTLHSKSLKRY